LVNASLTQAFDNHLMSEPSPKPLAGKPAAEALPDAALLDRDGEDGAGGALLAARTGFRRLLPSSVPGWTAAASILLATLAGTTAAALHFVFDEPSPAKSSTLAGPATVLDGSTLVVAGQTVRLQGIEAPPAALICRDGVWEYRCGADSQRALENLIANRPVDCNPVPSADGAFVGQCRSEQGIDLSAAMVEGGWAVADLRRSSRYFAQQAKAQGGAHGLWRNNFAYPEQWRLAARGETR